MEDIYDRCVADGKINSVEELEPERIKSTSESADVALRSASIIIKAINPKDREWTSVIKMNYDALRLSSLAYIMLDRLEVIDEEALFAALCVRHPELELDWEFLDNLRQKIERMDRGEFATFEDWKGIELRLTLYISALKKAIMPRLPAE
jgi:hypothetical protein